MGWHFKDGRIITTREEMLLEVAALVRVVRDEMPDASEPIQLARAMKLCKGGMNPSDIVAALRQSKGGA